MISIRHDPNSGGKFRVNVYDKGFGGWRKRGLTFEEALALVAHYYGEPHDGSICKHCQPEENKAEKSK